MQQMAARQGQGQGAWPGRARAFDFIRTPLLRVERGGASRLHEPLQALGARGPLQRDREAR